MMMMRSAKEYIQFADPAVEAICVANWSSDGVGLTMADAAAVTRIGTVFQGNTQITSFNELQYFTNDDEYLFNDASFGGCSSLQEITFPEGADLRAFYLCAACTSLIKVAVAGDEPLHKTGGDIFEACTLLKHTYANNIPQLLSLTGSEIYSYGNPQFRVSGEGHIYINNAEVFDVVVPNTMAVIPYFALQNCLSVTSVDLPSTITEVRHFAFAGCSSLATVICRATTPPTLGSACFNNNAEGRKIYVPHGTGNTYKAASGWSDYANDIYELNPDGTIPQ